MLKYLVPKFHSDLSVHLRGIAEKLVPVKLKPIVVDRCKPVSLSYSTPCLHCPAHASNGQGQQLWCYSDSDLGSELRSILAPRKHPRCDTGPEEISRSCLCVMPD